MTEMRPVWVLWIIVYSTFRNVATSASIQDAYNDQGVTKCLYEDKITAKEIKDCAESAYVRYLHSGPQKPFQVCNKACPTSLVGIDVPEPRVVFFLMTVWLFGTFSVHLQI